MFKRFIIILLSIVAGVGCDQQTKIWAKSTLVPGEIHSYFDGLFQIVLVENHGAFLGLGHSLPDSVKQALLVGIILSHPLI